MTAVLALPFAVLTLCKGMHIQGFQTPRAAGSRFGADIPGPDLALPPNYASCSYLEQSDAGCSNWGSITYRETLTQEGGGNGGVTWSAEQLTAACAQRSWCTNFKEITPWGAGHATAYGYLLGPELCATSGNLNFNVWYLNRTCLDWTTTAGAVGDPHLQNVHGERFDLMRPGTHVLINIPRGEPAESALFRVQADAFQFGERCSDMYFQEVHVTGSWAEAKQTGGYHHIASQVAGKTAQWVVFGKVQLKVVHGHTQSGIAYLNVYVKHLGRAGFPVGGLLGEDDHEDVSIVPASCFTKVALSQEKYGMHSPGSDAEASLA